MKHSKYLRISSVLLAALVSAAASSSELLSIYGEDSRKDLFEIRDQKTLGWAASTAAVIDRGDLTSRPDGRIQLSRTETYRDAYDLCEGERFAEQPSVSTCSSALVAPNLMLTAKHCLPRLDPCAKMHFVFDYAIRQQGQDPLVVSPEQVFRCAEIVLTHSGTGSDRSEYALIRLDRPVEGRTPLRLRTEGRPATGDRLVSIGNPVGLPTKVATGQVLNAGVSATFLASIDTFIGNSGGPLIGADSGLIEGVLTLGMSDHERDPSRGCNVEARYADIGVAGEVATLASFIAAGISAHLPAVTDPAAPPVVVPPPSSSACQLRSITYRVDGVKSAALLARDAEALPASLRSISPSVRARLGEVVRKRWSGEPYLSARLVRVAAQAFTAPSSDPLCASTTRSRGRPLELQVRSGAGITTLNGKDRQGRPIAGYRMIQAGRLPIEEFYLTEIVSLSAAP